MYILVVLHQLFARKLTIAVIDYKTVLDGWTPYDFIADKQHYDLDKEQKRFLKFNTFYGNEIVAGTRRLALMNLFLHNIGDIDSDNNISPADALIAPTDVRYDYVLANPRLVKRAVDLYQ